MLKKINFKYWRFKRYLRFAISTPICYLHLKINGAQIGRGNLFDGLIQVINQPGDTSIIIGNNCRFNSSSKSNLIGINHSCIFSTHIKQGRIRIGNNCGFSGTVIGAFTSIELGNHVQCGANTLITDADWHMSDSRVGPPKPIVIEDNVWLGYGTTVLKGVRIGKNSVIGAGSIVTSNIPPNVIAAGNPCKVIKEINK